MKYGASDSGSFSYTYRFSGMIPAYGAPDPALDSSFSSEVLARLMSDYASKGEFGADTYWGGKGLMQMALNMSFARQVGNHSLYEQSKARLRETFIDWLTYTPGEDNMFFAYYPRWGAMLGFDVSYDSDAFNDHHFHFGYFTYAAALLCLEDPDFAAQYGDILTLIAKDYANWDRSDSRFAFMRTLDPWCGHSWAGGLGDHGNDNGNGQESSSESMQSWGGLYLLGVALGDHKMRDAGIWGWCTEARATREYWYDVDAPRPANAGGRKPWAGKDDRQGNYDYQEYPYAYNSNITGKGIGWWTWFGGDPLYMHGIQWMPISPALDYLSWDPDFAEWALDDMLSGANSTFSHEWFEPTANAVSGDPIDPLATNDWGNVALAYMQRFDPKGAAAIFDEALSRGLHIATAVSTAHISYFVTHSHLTYGDPDFSVYADIPTAQMTVREGIPTYFVYNPEDTDRSVHFYSENGALLETVTAPPRRLVGISADPVVSTIECDICDTVILPPGSKTALDALALDQYGARMPDKKVSILLSDDAPASISGTTMTINADAPKGSQFALTLRCDDVSSAIAITVNDTPVVSQCAIIDLPEMCEVGTSVSPDLLAVDQYGSVVHLQNISWTMTDDSGISTPLRIPASLSRPGAYTLTASSASLDAPVSAQIVVTPPLPLISENAPAMASSAENVGTMPAGATDGDTNVRWGSAHTSDEWLVVDLGEECYISRAAIIWEAAYASHYELQTAPADAPLKTISVTYAGTPHTISVPVDEAWVTAADVRCSSAGEKVSAVNASGRYVRMRGLQRASDYGYSLYEMSIYGLRASTPHDDIIGIDFELPPTLDSGKTISLTPACFDRDGRRLDNIDVTWSADKDARFVGNEFTPLSHGMYTLTAALKGKTYTSAQLFVNEVERPASVAFESDTIATVAGRRTIIPFTVMNQFLAPYTGSYDDLHVTITDLDGHDCPRASFVAAYSTFYATEKGTYRLDFDGLGSCVVKALDISQVNLALGKRATATSSLGDSKPPLAVDGKLNTRWESAWEEPQYISIDLGSECRIDRIRLVWENAYAKAYRLQASLDGETWSDFYATDDSNGDTEEPIFDPINARHIRLCCDRRALSAYGFSLYELEAYGDDHKGTSEAPAIYGTVATGQEYWYDL